MTEDELIGLLEIGRAEVLLPQPLQRYRPNLVARLVEAATPGDIIGSRELALRTMRGLARVNRLVFHVHDLRLRRLVLGMLAKVESQLPAHQATYISAQRAGLSRAWVEGPHSVHRMGAMGVGSLGRSFAIAEFRQRMGHGDAWLEYDAAARLVEWGLAAGSVLAPMPMKETGGYDHSRFVEVMATAYNPGAGPPHHRPVLPTLIDDVLAIDNGIPVLELATAFAGSDIDRFRDVLLNLDSVEPHYRDEVVRAFNDEVRAFGERRERWTTWRLASSRPLQVATGTVGAAVGGALAPDLAPVLADWAPVIGSAAGLSAQHVLEWMSSALGLGSALDRVPDDLAARAAGVSPSAVVVARMKRQLNA